MPVIQRRQLRQEIGLYRLRELTLGVTTYSPALGVGSAVIVMDRFLAIPDLSMANESPYTRSWWRVGTSDYRVGSFNFGSGAFLSNIAAFGAIASGDEFEIHARLAPSDIDRAISETILDQRVNREVTIQAIDGAHFYTLDGAASPHRITSVLDVFYYTNPGGSLDRGPRYLTQEQVVTTMSGVELRIPGGLQASWQIAIDAILQMTLSVGSGMTAETATMNMPDRDVLLWGAEARCWNLMIKNSPGQQVADMVLRRNEAVAQYNRLAVKRGPRYDRRIRLSAAFEADSDNGPW